MANETKSPIKDKPLRLPAQSLMERRESLIEDKLLLPFIIAGFLLIATGAEWYQYFVPRKPSPYFYSAVTLAAFAFFAWRFLSMRGEFRNLRLAIDGEKVVGQFLERLRADGYDVFHDVIGDGFNLDHVVIGPAGIFTIETKTRSKPSGKDARIKFDGALIEIGGFAPDRNPVIQAKAQASWLARILQESTGKKLSVRSVILFPGWFIEPSTGATQDLWVLEPKALPSFLGQSARVLGDEDIKLASFHLSRFIRTTERER